MSRLPCGGLPASVAGSEVTGESTQHGGSSRPRPRNPRHKSGIEITDPHRRVVADGGWSYDIGPAFCVFGLMTRIVMLTTNT